MSALTLQWGAPVASHELLPASFISFFMILNAWMKARQIIAEEQVSQTCLATRHVLSLDASESEYSCSKDECRLDMAGKSWRSSTLVYGPWAACSSSCHFLFLNSVSSHRSNCPSLCGPALSSWWQAMAPVHGPSSATSASNWGKRQSSQRPFKANLGFDGVPVSVPVTLQSWSSRSPLLFLMGLVLDSCGQWVHS